MHAFLHVRYSTSILTSLPEIISMLYEMCHLKLTENEKIPQTNRFRFVWPINCIERCT